LLRRQECLVLLLVVVKRYVVKNNLVCAAQHTSFHVLRKEQYSSSACTSFLLTENRTKAVGEHRERGVCSARNLNVEDGSLRRLQEQQNPVFTIVGAFRFLCAAALFVFHEKMASHC
jgi:hypothetical protein